MKLTAKIGVIQLTDERIRLLVIKTGGATPQVLERVDEPLASLGDDPEVTREEHVAQITQCIQNLKQAPSLYILNTPQSWSVMRLLSVPFKGAKKVRAALTFELEPYLAVPIEDLTIDYLTVGEFEGQTEVFVMGLQKQRVADQVALLNAAGVSIEGFGLDTIGLSALALENLSTDSSPKALVMEHQGVGYLSVVRNNSLAYAQRLSSSPTQPVAWIREVQNALRAFHATSLESIELQKILCIDLGVDEDTIASLEEQTELTVEACRWSHTALPSELVNDEDSSTWLSMVGAATSVAGNSFNVSFQRDNLNVDTAPNPFVRHALSLVALILVVVFAQLGTMHLKAKKNVSESERIGQAVWAEFAATYPNDPLAKERPANDLGGQVSFEAMQAAIDTEQSRGTALTPQMFNQASLPNMLKEVAAYVPSGLATLEEIKVMPGRRRPLEISLRGIAKNPEAYGKILEGIKQSPILEFHDGQRSMDSGKLTFTIIFRLKEDTTEAQ